MSKARLHCVIRGSVQGVFFRASTCAEAKRLGLSGWVKNQPDGTVECVAEGEKEKLEVLAAWCKSGPSDASVSTCEVQWGKWEGKYTSFTIRY